MAEGLSRAPAGLGAAGRAFWRRVMGRYDALEPSELELLTQVCRTLDLIAVLEATVAAEGPMATGSKGQPIVHPAVSEVRLQRAQLGRTLDQLGLPTEDSEAKPSSPLSRRASKAARSRWDRQALRMARPS